MVSKTQILVDALKSVTDAVSEYYSADTCREQYIVWQPDSEGSEVAGDNIKEMYSLRFTVDVYAKRPAPELLKQLEAAFNAAYISFSLTSVEYDSENQVIDYTYEVEI